MENVIKNCSVYQYADDTCLIASHRDLLTATRFMQNDFTQVAKWAHDAGLVMNTGKTKIIHVHSSHLPADCSFKIFAHSHNCLHSPTPNCSCPEIEQLSQHTYLGLIVDNRFNWQPHINAICDKLRAILAKFYIIKPKVPYKVLVKMYTALAESIITYGITSYGRTFKTYLDQIYNLQLRILKLILPKSLKIQFQDNYYNIFKHCNIIPVHEKVNMSLLIEQFNNSDILIPIEHKIITRKIIQKKLVVPKMINYYGRRTISFLIPTLLNNIPDKIKLATNNRNYKNIYKKHFLSNL